MSGRTSGGPRFKAGRVKAGRVQTAQVRASRVQALRAWTSRANQACQQNGPEKWISKATPCARPERTSQPREPATRTGRLARVALRPERLLAIPVVGDDASANQKCDSGNSGRPIDLRGADDAVWRPTLIHSASGACPSRCIHHRCCRCEGERRQSLVHFTHLDFQLARLLMEGAFRRLYSNTSTGDKSRLL